MRDSPDARLGQPIANTHFHVLDRSGNVAPIGATGEICIAGTNGSESGDRGIGTGELGRLRSNGVVEFLGRTDRLFYSCGWLIDPKTIESALLRHESVVLGSISQPHE